MSVSVQQILADAKRLAGRLKDHDSSADVLLSQAQAMFCQVDAMKEVCRLKHTMVLFVCNILSI